MKPPSVHRGTLGWSNRRAGVEFYRALPSGENGRHVAGGRDQGGRTDGMWGSLLVDEIDPNMRREGSRVLVVVADPTDHASLPLAEAAVRVALSGVATWRVRLARWLLS